MAFNKMFVMIPVMLAARKIDGEDPNIIYWLRVAYFSVQCIIVMLVAYTYVQAGAAKGNTDMIYVPPPATPFADPNAKKKYTQAVFGKHVIGQARSLLLSTVFGICLTTGLHFYKGMVIGLAIQSIMAPLNMFENKLVMAYLYGKPIDRTVFEAKTAEELTNDDEVVDEGGNPVVVRTSATSSTAGRIKDGSSLEDILLDTWDAGSKADLGPLMSALNKKNCNFATKESGWTPVMILCGLNTKGSGSAIRQVLEMGGNPAMTDQEGWNAMHWAGFHGSVEAAKVLRDETPSLATVKDKEGKTPLEHARAEGNDDVSKVLEQIGQEGDGVKSNDDGLRKRK